MTDVAGRRPYQESMKWLGKREPVRQA